MTGPQIERLPDGRIAVTGEWHCAGLGETTVTVPEEAFALAVQEWNARHPSAAPAADRASSDLAHARRRIATLYVALGCLVVLMCALLYAVSRHTTADPGCADCPTTRASAWPTTTGTVPTAPTPSVPTLVAPR